MWMRNTISKAERRLRTYDRRMLRAAFVSLFWVAITEKRKRGSFTFQDLAKVIGRHKSALSRWFATKPNWTIDTIADLASALDLEIHIEARERSTGTIITPTGVAFREQAAVEVRPTRIPDSPPIQRPGPNPWRVTSPYLEQEVA